MDVCQKEYVFNTLSEQKYKAGERCPAMAMPQSLATAYVNQQTEYLEKFEELLAKDEGRSKVPTARLTYSTALPGIDIIAPKKAAESSITTGSVNASGEPSGDEMTETTKTAPAG